MFSETFDPVIDTQCADWLVERCNGPLRKLNAIVPIGFPSYLRVCHPAWSVEAIDKDDDQAWTNLRAGFTNAERKEPIEWAAVAQLLGKIPHRLMQWHEICDLSRDPGTKGIDSPFEGELSEDQVDAILSIFLSDGDQVCYCGFWEGWGNMKRYRSFPKYESVSGTQSYILFRSSLSRLRDYWLNTLELAKLDQFGETAGWVPNAIWPASEDWYFALPYNHPSSYFGGPSSMTAELDAAAMLECYDAFLDDDVWSGDINGA